MFPASLLVLLAALVAAPAVQSVVPNFRDLTLKIRDTRGLSRPMVTTWYFKGPRERYEHSSAYGFNAEIIQCDLRTIIHLNEHAKTYTSFPNGAVNHDNSRRVQPMHAPTGSDVTVTMDSVDTGERRQVGGYEARHIKSTVKITPSQGGASYPGRVELDSWYLDLPGLYCLEGNHRHLNVLIMGMLRQAGHSDHIVEKYIGVEPSGFIIEETATQRQGGNVIRNKTELLEVSDQPLDDSLFEIPPDYRPSKSAHTGLSGTVR